LPVFALDWEIFWNFLGMISRLFSVPGPDCRPSAAHERAKRWRVAMDSVQAKPADQRRLTGQADIKRASGRFKAFVTAILRRRDATTDHVVPGYEGYAWCDSSERQLNADITACRRARLF
jgi:hypothetical protein